MKLSLNAVIGVNASKVFEITDEMRGWDLEDHIEDKLEVIDNLVEGIIDAALDRIEERKDD